MLTYTVRNLLIATSLCCLPIVATSIQAQPSSSQAEAVELSYAEQLLLQALPDGVGLDTASQTQIKAALSTISSANAQNSALVRDVTIAAATSPAVSNNLSITVAVVSSTSAIASASVSTSTEPTEETASTLAIDTVGEVVASVLAASPEIAQSPEASQAFVSEVLASIGQSVDANNRDNTIQTSAVAIIDNIAEQQALTDQTPQIAASLVGVVIEQTDAETARDTIIEVVETIEDSLTDEQVQAVADQVFEVVVDAAENDDAIQDTIADIVDGINDDTVAIISLSGSSIQISLL